MTNTEMLQAYRAAVLYLDELTMQLERMGSNGAPQGVRSLQLDGLRGTNDPAAAALQAAEGMEAMIRQKRDELAELSAGVWPLLGRIGDYRTYMVIQRYYLQGHSDSDIARNLCISRTRVNQIRHSYLSSVS